MTSSGVELSGAVEDADSVVLHPYYRLLPSYITPESIQAERRDLLRRIQEALTCLRALRDGDAPAGGRELQNRHFRDLDTFYKLKYVLPTELHAQLIRLLVDLLWARDGRAFADVDMEIRAVKALQLLLKKWKKRQRAEGLKQQEEIVIEWRIVKRAMERVCFSAPGGIQQASQVYLAKLAASTVKCGEVARSFFRASDSAVPLVKELWTEFAATITDVKTTECFRAMAFFSSFIAFPVSEDTASAEEVVEELLPEWFATWALISRCAEWDGHWMKVMSRVTKRHPSTAMWGQYLPFLFAKVQDLLDLPSDLGSPFKKNLWPSVYSSINGSKRFGQHAMRLCVYLLRNANEDGSDAASTRYVLEILSMMKSFFHPSNVANAANSLGVFVYYLSNALGKRLGREKALAEDARALKLASCGGLVDALLEICLLGIYSKNGGVTTKCVYVVKNLMCIDPVRCTTPVMQEMLKALDPMAMSHSHLAATAISSMAVFLYHLMCGRHPGSTGLFFSTYLDPILKLTLPGIDANDEKKTQSTVRLYFHLLSWLPLVNDPAKANFQATKQRGELSNQMFADMEDNMFAEMAMLDSETEQKMWEAGPSLEEWTLALLDRCFQFIQSRSGSRASDRSRDGSSSKKDGTEDAIVLQVLDLMAIVYPQMSPEIYAQALRKTVAFVSNTFFTTSFGGEVISTLIFNCMQGNPSQAIAQFMPLLLEKLCATRTTVDVSGLMTNEKVWYLHILDGMVRFGGVDEHVLLVYQDELRVILTHFLNNEEDKEVQETAATVLHNLLVGLLGVYTHDFRSLPSEEWADATSRDSGAFQYLGASTSWNKLSVEWHEPNEAELAFGFELLQAHVLSALDELEEMKRKTNLIVRSWTRRLNQVLEGLSGAASVLVDDAVVADSALVSGAMPLLLKALMNNPNLLEKYVALKRAVMTQVQSLVAFWRESGSGSAMESQLWVVLLAIMNQLLIWRGEHLDEFKAKEKQNMYAKAATLDAASHAFRKARSVGRRTSKGDEVLLVSRNELVEKVLFFYSKRKVQQHFTLAHTVLQPEAGSNTREVYESLLGEVETLLRNPYEDVRANAAAVMKECSSFYGKWIYSRQPKLIEELEGFGSDESTELKEEQVSGLLHMLSLPLARRHLWKKRDSLLKRVLMVLLKSNDAIVKNVDSELGKVKVGMKLQTFFLSALSNWRYIHGQNASPPLLEELIAAEPPSTEHWKFQLMHLVMLYPFLQPEEMPVSLGVWKLVIRQLSNEVLPVRQIAVVLFAQLVKLLKCSRMEGDSPDVSAVDALIYSESTMRILVDAFVNNHKNSSRFAASADGQHAESAPSDWSFGVNELIRHISSNTHSFPKASPLSSVRLLNQSSDTFRNVSLSGAKLVQRLVQNNPTAFLESGVIEMLSELGAEKIGAEIADEDRQAALRTLAEWTAGLLHALMKLSDLDEQSIANHVAVIVELFKEILPNLSVVLVDQWVEVMYLASRPSSSGAVKLSRLEPLVSYLLQELEDSFIRATVEDYARQAKWLSIVESVGIHVLAASVSTSDPSVHALASHLSERVLRVIREHALTHQYKIIRDRAGKMLFVLGAYGFPSSLWSVQSSSCPVAASALPLDHLATTAAVNSDDVDYGKDAPKEGDAEHATSLHAKETAMQWLSCCEKHGDTRDMIAVLDALLPVALLSQHDPKPEVAVQAKNVTDAVSSSLRMYFVPRDEMGERNLDSLFALLERLSTSQIWKTRGAVLRFVMTFAFYHWVFFSSELKQRIHALVSAFLTDEQREVQAMAKYALRSLIHNEQPAVVEAMSVRLTLNAQQARTKFPKLQRRCQRLEADHATEEELEKARQRVRAIEAEMTKSVLGLSAIVLAFPHDVPDFVPPMFEELGRFLYLKKSSSTVSYLEKAVKETLLDFKRTHQDNWLETKTKFSRAQLDVIEDVAIAPSYFS